VNEAVQGTRRPGPYAHAPRLPEGEQVALASLAKGAWLELEIGPGPKAGFLLERAAAAPEVAIVGLEIRKKWATVGDERLAKQGYGDRARVFCEDARLALPRLRPDGSVKRVFLHFPDPWWKKRHHKRLVMGDVFLDEVARLLEPAGELYVQTDVEERAELYEGAVARHPAFETAGESPGSPRIAENPFHARSPREHRAIADGLPVWRMLWRRR
jgi:tRNA (guanine-N7-)-methyltransferase